MESSKILEILCRKCHQFIDINDKNHKCSTITSQPQYNFTNNSSNISASSVSSNSVPSNYTSYFETEESSNNDGNIGKDYDEFYTKLITAINERPPLWDHRLPMSARYENIKQSLWNEIYATLNDAYPINILKEKWQYLKEKYVRENRKPANGAEGGKKKIWCHMNALQFLNDVVGNNYKTITNLKRSLPDKEIQEERAQKTNYYKSTKKPKIDSFEQDLVKVLREAKPVPPTVLVVKNDGDLHYCKYLSSIMKKLPTKKKLTLQLEFIKRVIENLEDSVFQSSFQSNLFFILYINT